MVVCSAPVMDVRAQIIITRQQHGQVSTLWSLYAMWCPVPLVALTSAFRSVSIRPFPHSFIWGAYNYTFRPR